MTNQTPISAISRVTTADREAVECEKRRLDQVQAEKEWATYLATGVVSSDGLNLIYCSLASVGRVIMTVLCILTYCSLATVSE